MSADDHGRLGVGGRGGVRCTRVRELTCLCPSNPIDVMCPSGAFHVLRIVIVFGVESKHRRNWHTYHGGEEGRGSVSIITTTIYRATLEGIRLPPRCHRAERHRPPLNALRDSSPVPRRPPPLAPPVQLLD